jgi:hypothetical protein
VKKRYCGGESVDCFLEIGVGGGFGGGEGVFTFTGVWIRLSFPILSN